MGSYVNEQMRDLLSKRRPSNITIDWEAIKKLDSGIGSTIQCYQFLYGLVTMLQPKRIIEIGMNTGVSTIVMAQALRDLNASAEHNIITIDPDRNTAHKAFEQLDQFGLKKYVESYLLPSREGIPKALHKFGPFQLAFIDGDHSYAGVKLDYEILKGVVPYLVLHDLNSPGVAQFLLEICDSKDNEAIRLFPFANGQQWSIGNIVYENAPGFALIRGRA